LQVLITDYNSILTATSSSFVDSSYISMLHIW